ncbi:hypothetical protein [Pseudonocardia kujensis]|uniref:hypothetical protein n=1 Tax=Pseudonocardia kujensis TaxID=1128675 RepID=UPI0035592389
MACLQRRVSAREAHGGEVRIRAARFPARKSLEDFSFDHARGLKRDRTAQGAGRQSHPGCRRQPAATGGSSGPRKPRPSSDSQQVGLRSSWGSSADGSPCGFPAIQAPRLCRSCSRAGRRADPAAPVSAPSAGACRRSNVGKDHP